MSTTLIEGVVGTHSLQLRVSQRRVSTVSQCQAKHAIAALPGNANHLLPLIEACTTGSVHYISPRHLLSFLGSLLPMGKCTLVLFFLYFLPKHCFAESASLHISKNVWSENTSCFPPRIRPGYMLWHQSQRYLSTLPPGIFSETHAFWTESVPGYKRVLGRITWLRC